MFNFSISSMGVYRKPEKYRQRIECPWLSVNLSGLIYYRLSDSKGNLIVEQKKGEAGICFGLPGMVSDFEFGEQRENWVVMFGDIPLRYSAVPEELEVRDGDSWVSMPVLRKLPAESIPSMRAEMRRLMECFRNPVPENRFRGKLIIAGFLEFMMGNTRGALKESPAGKLKRLIDDDMEFRYTISELSDKCEYSCDHLRVLFRQEFRISPKEYRHQKRMAKIMEYVSGTQMTLKEIAAATGFEHPSHLSMAFRKTFGSSPREAIRKFRHQSGF